MSYTFTDPFVNALQQAVYHEALALTKEGIWTAQDLGRRFSEKNQQQTIDDYNPHRGLAEGKYDYQTGMRTNVGNSSFINDEYKMTAIRFDSVNYGDLYGNNNKTPVLDIHICGIDASYRIDMIRTKLMGEEGTVKETWAGDDWNITISGVLVGTFGQINIEQGDYLNLKPTKLLNDLTTIVKSKASIPIVCQYLNQLGITSIVIENIDLPFESQWRNLQRFTIKAYSDNNNITLIR